VESEALAETANRGLSRGFVPAAAFVDQPTNSKNHMSVQMVDASNGLVTAKIPGKLKPDEQARFQKCGADLISKEGKARARVVSQP
jgi:hypothetical protein